MEKRPPTDKRRASNSVASLESKFLNEGIPIVHRDILHPTEHLRGGNVKNGLVGGDLERERGKISAREEFCLVTGLKFGVEYWTDFDNDEDPIPFRRRVFPSSLDGEHITCKIVEKLIDNKSFDRLHNVDAVSLCCVGILQLVFLGVEGRRIIPDWILRLANDRVGWDKYPRGSYVWPILYSQLKDANVRRWPSLYASQPIDQVDKKTYSIFEFTWAFKGNLPVARLTPDDIEARSERWVSSRAYFDGVIDQAERVPRFLNRQNMFEVPSDFYRDFEQQKKDLEQQKRDLEEIRKKNAEREKMYEQMHTFMEGMNVGPVREANTRPIIVNQHYEMNDFSEFQSNQGGRSSFQTLANNSFLNMGTPTNWQTPMPSHCQIPSHMGNLNSQTPIETHPDTAGLLDQNKVHKATVLPLNLGNVFDDDNEESDDIMFMGGQFTGNMLVYENVDPNKVRRDNYVNLLEQTNQVGWLSGDHMNSWMELLIRSRPENAPWTMAKTGTMFLNNPTSQIVESSHAG
ncbi:hypothetical protein Tco_0474529 [Tanacetum coccineum]